MSAPISRSADRLRSLCRRTARQATMLLCVALAGSGALELHNLANHHRAIESGGLIDRAAAHPRIPHHFDRSEELREPACATCALQAQARGVQAAASGAVAPGAFRPLEPPAQRSPSLPTFSTSASPRGPPAA